MFTIFDRPGFLRQAYGLEGNSLQRNVEMRPILGRFLPQINTRTLSYQTIQQGFSDSSQGYTELLNSSIADYNEKKEDVSTKRSSDCDFTQEDFDNLSSFFTQPSNDVYEDPETGIQYVQPDHSQILASCSSCFFKGEYKGFGLSLRKKINGEICDMVYLEKKADQLSFESKTEHPRGKDYLFSFLNQFSFGGSEKHSLGIRSRIEKQQNLALEAEALLRGQYEKWKYEDYVICGRKKLLQLGFSEKDAKEMDAVIFYYKTI